MRGENDCSAIFKDPRIHLLGIFHIVGFIILILVLVQRIRRRNQKRYVSPGGGMDPQSEKCGGVQQEASAPEEGLASQKHHACDPAPFPSACDILQPLSHSSPLPPSGYLAAILGRELSTRMEGVYAHGSQQTVNSDKINPTDSGPCDSQTAISLGTNHDSGIPQSGIRYSLPETGESSWADIPPTGGSGIESHKQGNPRSSDCSEIQSVQKRSDAVHFLHDVDEEGLRSWKRWVVEYS